MTGKLNGLHAISTNTITNEFCQKMNASKKASQICRQCYSHQMLKSYRKNMQPSLQRNSDVLAKSILDVTDIPFYIDAFMRINAHGELINNNHFINIINIALKNPHCNFALWSKRKSIVNAVVKLGYKIPSNLILVFSNPTINKIMYEPPEHFHKVFNNVEYDHKIDEQNCTGQRCIDCRKCYNHNNFSVIIEATKLNGRTIKK